MAAVHCKAGKGRTGLVVVCYLMFSGFRGGAAAARDFYDWARTTDGKGLTIPSQAIGEREAGAGAEERWGERGRTEGGGRAAVRGCTKTEDRQADRMAADGHGPGQGGGGGGSGSGCNTFSQSCCCCSCGGGGGGGGGGCNTFSQSCGGGGGGGGDTRLAR